MNGAKAYTADESAQVAQWTEDYNDEIDPILIDFLYSDEDFTKYDVDKSLVNHAEFDYALRTGYCVEIIENEVKGALLIKSNRLSGSSTSKLIN